MGEHQAAAVQAGAVVAQGTVGEVKLDHLLVAVRLADEQVGVVGYVQQRLGPRRVAGIGDHLGRRTHS